LISAPTTVKQVVIQENIPESGVSGLAEFIERYYITQSLPSMENSSYRKREEQGRIEFSWKLKVTVRNEITREVIVSTLSVNLKISVFSVELNFDDLNPNDTQQMKLCSKTTDDIQNIVWSYLQHSKMSSLYFVIGSGREKKHSESPNQRTSTRRAFLRRIFAGNTANMFLSFMFLSFFLFFIIGVYTIFVVIVLQLIALIYSDKIILSLGNVQPTAQRPYVTIISVRSTPETLRSLATQGSKILSRIREEITESVMIPSASMSDLLNIKSAVLEILTDHGITTASINDIEIKTRGVYDLVQRVSKKFNLPTPKITILNTIVDNASATGISPKRSSIMITAGALEDLDDEELASVVGHELGHIKGHDSLILFGVTSFEFVGRFYLWFPLLLYLGLFYFVLAFGAIYGIGKFLETRADTESAVIVGNPEAMASSLKKIGFRQLYHEKYSQGAKLLDWFRFDPHPPIYFRVARMSQFPTRKVKHTLLISVRDCIVGFLSAFTSL
jgi:heat shock protein HtpX